MKRILFIVYLLLLQTSYAQSSNKKEILYDENWNPIEAQLFRYKIKVKRFVYKLIENDTAYIGKIFLREEIGKITLDDKRTLLESLKSLTSKEVDSNKIIVINFFEKENSCLTSYRSDRKYKKLVSQNPKVEQFFVTEKGYMYQKKDVYEDTNNSIKELLFQYPFRCGNYIIIKTDGSFLRHLGEHHQDKILEKINEDW